MPSGQLGNYMLNYCSKIQGLTMLLTMDNSVRAIAVVNIKLSVTNSLVIIII